MSYPPESSTPPSEELNQLSHNQQTCNDNHITTETTKIPVSHPSTVPKIQLVFLLEEIHPEVTNLQSRLHIKEGGSVVTCNSIVVSLT